MSKRWENSSKVCKPEEIQSVFLYQYRYKWETSVQSDPRRYGGDTLIHSEQKQYKLKNSCLKIRVSPEADGWWLETPDMYVRGIHSAHSVPPLMTGHPGSGRRSAEAILRPRSSEFTIKIQRNTPIEAKKSAKLNAATWVWQYISCQ